MMSDRYSMWVRYWYDTSYDTGTRYDRYDTKEGVCSTRTDAVLSLSLSLSLFSLSVINASPASTGPCTTKMRTKTQTKTPPSPVWSVSLREPATA